MFPAHIAAQLPLQLSSEQCDAYTEVAYGVRDQAITLYEAYLKSTTSTVPAFDPREWRLLKKKDQFQIYASRTKHHATAYQSPHASTGPIHRSAEWHPQSKLRCIDSYVGSLDDAMYGCVTTTDSAMMVRSLAIPTKQEPFTYVGLKWSARPPYFATMVKPRDVTYVQATGFCTVLRHGKQERAGFHVYHSMDDIPGMLDFQKHGFRRCRYSLCMLCLPTDSGTVDVFLTTAANAGGDLPRNLTTLMSATALMATHKVMDNTRQKKLGWLRYYYTTKSDDKTVSVACLGGTSSAHACPQCSRECSVLHPLKRCGVCETNVCSRCMTAQTLVVGATKATLRPANVATCHGCLTAVTKMDVRALAIMEFVRPFESVFVDSFHLTVSIVTDSSRDFSASFFGAHESARFFSISSEFESESER